MSEPIIAIPVERLRQRADLFRCVPYRATILAGACEARQESAGRQAQQDYRRPLGERLSGDYRHCVKCALGTRVLERLRAADEAGEGSSP